MTAERTIEERVAQREGLLAQLRAVLIEDLHVRVPAEVLDPDTPLFGSGLGLDSVDAVDLVVGIEERTGHRLPDDWQGRAALRSLNTLVDFLVGAEATP